MTFIHEIWILMCLLIFNGVITLHLIHVYVDCVIVSCIWLLHVKILCNILWTMSMAMTKQMLSIEQHITVIADICDNYHNIRTIGSDFWSWYDFDLGMMQNIHKQNQINVYYKEIWWKLDGFFLYIPSLLNISIYIIFMTYTMSNNWFHLINVFFF